MIDMTADFSVAMNAYNRENEIGETLEAVLGQSLPPREIVVMDDGSVDGTASVVARFFPHVIYERMDNAGPGLSRHAAVARCSSPWIAICDSDDIWESNHLQSLAETRAEFPDAVFVFANSTRFGVPGSAGYNHFESIPEDWWTATVSERRGTRLLFDNEAYAHLLAFNPVYPSCLSFDASVYAAIGGVHPPFSRLSNEDSDITRRLALAGLPACCTDITVAIRKHEGNFSADNTSNLFGKYLILDHHLSKLNLSEQFRNAALEERDRTLLNAFRSAYWNNDLETAQRCRELMPTGLDTWKDRLRLSRLRIRHLLLGGAH